VGEGEGQDVVLSQKSQYAVRAVFELAKREGSGPVKAAQVADSQYIPVRFLENILGQLRQAGIVESTRGKDGGYRLSRRARQITVGEIIRVMQGPMSAIDCAKAEMGLECPLRAGCVLLPMWERAHQAMMDVYDSTNFQDLVEQEARVNQSGALVYSI
jgi:Rrf2 family protein